MALADVQKRNWFESKKEIRKILIDEEISSQAKTRTTTAQHGSDNKIKPNQMYP